ncbi:hypothetical protein [Mycolicibacterium sphagni]|nr:hypothetical protein [Mycolicibacterium sphagni]
MSGQGSGLLLAIDRLGNTVAELEQRNAELEQRNAQLELQLAELASKTPH